MVPYLPWWGGTIPIGRYVAGKLGRLVCWGCLAGGYRPARKHCRLFLLISKSAIMKGEQRTGTFLEVLND